MYDKKTQGQLRTKTLAVAQKMRSAAIVLRSAASYIESTQPLLAFQEDADMARRLATQLDERAVAVEAPVEEWRERKYQHGQRISSAISRREAH